MTVKHLHVKHATRAFNFREQLREHSIKEHEGKRGDSTREELTFACESCNITFTLQKILDNTALSSISPSIAQAPHLWLLLIPLLQKIGSR
jgi:hypothetical protein